MLKLLIIFNMKKNLKMELLNSEVEQQVQGGASRFAMDFTMPGGLATNALMAPSAMVQSANFGFQNVAKAAGDIIINCTTWELRPCEVVECPNRSAVR